MVQALSEKGKKDGHHQFAILPKKNSALRSRSGYLRKEKYTIAAGFLMGKNK